MMDAVLALQRWLNKRGISPDDFARAVDIRPQELARILDRKDVPKPRDAQRIVDFTAGEVTLSELLFPEGRLRPEDRHPDPCRGTIITHDVRLDLLQVQDGSVPENGEGAVKRIDE